MTSGAAGTFGSSGVGHPLAYPILTTVAALLACLAAAPFADLEQLSMLAAVAALLVGYSAVRFAVALGALRMRPVAPDIAPGIADCRRVRQQHRLLSRSWLELDADGRTRWLPV